MSVTYEDGVGLCLIMYRIRQERTRARVCV
jgi:hypothetical protein